MSFRLTRYRLKTEWLRILLGLMFAVILFSWYGAGNVVANLYHSMSSFSLVYEMGVERLAESIGVDADEPALAELDTAYRFILQESRGFVYSRLVISVNDPIYILLANALAVLFLTGLFQKKRLGPPLAAGLSRGRLFFSLTAVYFSCVVLVWVISANYLIKRYFIVFSPEEQDFFRVTQLTWFCAFLWKATVAYLAAMLLRRPLPAFLAALTLSFAFLLANHSTPNVLPSWIIGGGSTVKSWDPGADLWPMLRTDMVAAFFFVITIIIGWFSFRKRGVE